MDKDMEKSFRLLENVLKPRDKNLSNIGLRGEKRSFGHFNPTLEGSCYDDPSVSQVSLSKFSKIRRSDINNLSITIAHDEISKLWEYEESGRGGTADLDNLYQQFQEAVELHGNTQQVFDAISLFVDAIEAYYSITTEALHEQTRNTALEKSDLNWLVNEKKTWQLVYGLYRDRVLHRDEEDEANLSLGIDPTEHPTTEKEVMLELYKNESSVREGQLIIDWLERVAREELNDVWGARVGHCLDRTVGWENTLHQLENTEVSIMSTRQLVTALDPDAPTRQLRSLHDLDIEDESRLLSQIFLEIRRGCLDKAQELCVHSGQSWRAATLEGWRLHHDPNYRNDNPNEKLPVEGNAHRDIWKLCAWSLCEDERVPVVARSVMGALCGHLDAVLASCPTWEDTLWARARAAVDRRVERAVRGAGLRSYVPMPDKYWNGAQLTLDEVFREMHGSEGLSAEASRPDRVVQELVALDRVGELVSAMAGWAPAASPQCLRFFAHLVIILRLFGRSAPLDPGDAVLTAFTKVLMEEGDPKLVAFYVSMLPEEDQTHLYASFMETVTENEKRKECIKAAEKYSLDIKTITKRVVQNIRDRALASDEGEAALSKEATAADLEKVSALDWVVYYQEQRAEALWHANALMRSFIGQGKLECARQAFEKIPRDSVTLIMTQYNCKVDADFRVDLKALPPKVNAAIKEYLCLKAYLDAMEGFSDWFQDYHTGRPVPPPQPEEEDDYAGRVVHEQRVSRYNQGLDRWKAAIGHRAKEVKAQLYNVIIFPDSGWLIDDYEEDEVRRNQLQTLRSYCLPEIVMLLHKVLHSMEEYEECLDLGSLVMGEEFCIYKTFNQHQLSDLLVKMAESSRVLLQKCGDPFADLKSDTESDLED